MWPTGSSRAPDVVRQYRGAAFMASNEVGHGVIEADGTHRADVV